MQPNPCFQPLEIRFSWESHERFPGKGNLSWGFPFSCESWESEIPKFYLLNQFKCKIVSTAGLLNFFPGKRCQ